ncbi:HupE/UreJ family protein [Phyllobacterium sp. A18/5-2]|uniref:HupE/UreJ family protein n=1 Tax=Phyllobacterium sp. A18/5-2 TaxID=2978392 RepID=UPI0029056C80|nr:HupE/UreJ family protein [Phyllobacterium sp. A18/5-2]
MTRLLIVLSAALILVSGHAHAHDLRPAYLSITESLPQIYSVLWKAPAMGERRLAVYPRLPLSAAERTPHEGAILNDAYVERWTVHAPTGFAGETITFDGLPESRTDVLVHLERLNGEVSTARLTPANPSLTVPAVTGWQQVAATYVWLGVGHILFGIDHLLFVLALILLAESWKRIAVTVTAFTVAHSITLGAATARLS